MDSLTITVSEAAALLGVSSRHAYELAASGRLPGAIRLSGRVVVIRRQLLAFLGEPA